MDENITSKIAEAISSYYSGHPIMDDEEYEELIAPYSDEEVEELKRSSIVVLDKVKHLWPMTSLPKARSLDEVRRLPEGDMRHYELKYDGCSIEVHYGKDGIMDWACTRGDYTYGDNRTKLVDKLIDLLKVPSTYKPEHSIRGELVISDEDWPSISSEYANQRNAASGIANRDDLKHADKLTFVPYDDIEDATGYTTSFDNACCHGEDFLDVMQYSDWGDAEQAFHDANVPVDGLVIKDFHDGMQTYAIAYKFSDETFETTLKDVVWQQGKSGKLTPVAVFETVFIDAEVSRASLGSYARFCELGLHYGDTIVVHKANMVIPYVDANLGGGNDEVMAPQFWSGASTYVKGAHLYAERDNRWLDILNRQVSMLAGKGIGPKFVQSIVEQYGVQTITEMHSVVNEDGFHFAKGNRVKSLANAREALDEVGKASLIALVVSLGLDGMSYGAWSKLLAKVAMVAKANGKAQCEQLMQIEHPYEFAIQIAGIGDSVARQFAGNQELLHEQLDDFYREFGHWPSDFVDKQDASEYEVCITGRFDGIKRSDICKLLEANGFAVSGSVSKHTFALVAGIGGGGKRKAAEANDVPTIDTGGDIQKGFDALLQMTGASQVVANKGK